jgi:hypothetical protein
MSRTVRGFGKADRGDHASAQAANEARCAAQRRQAAQVVAGMAIDAEDCAQLLAMLGLDGRRVGRRDASCSTANVQSQYLFDSPASGHG